MTSSIQNACMARHSFTNVLYAKFKLLVLEKLLERKYINDFKVVTLEDGIKKEIEVSINYSNNVSYIRKINVISKPSQKVYKSVNKFKTLNAKNNIHMDYLITTSKGVMWLNEAEKQNIGGKLLLSVMLNYKAFKKNI